VSVAKVHWIREANVGPTKIVTHCGRVGYHTSMADEYDMVSGDRYEAVKDLSRVTCGVCLRSAKRITEGLPRKGAFLHPDAKKY
jgi:hypothetical protein